MMYAWKRKGGRNLKRHEVFDYENEEIRNITINLKREGEEDALGRLTGCKNVRITLTHLK